jgi:hypothetical protein
MSLNRDFVFDVKKNLRFSKIRFDHSNKLVFILLKSSLYLCDLKSMAFRVMRFSSQKAAVSSDFELVLYSEESVLTQEQYQFAMWRDHQVALFTWNLLAKNSEAASKSVSTEHPIVHVGLYPVIESH